MIQATPVINRSDMVRCALCANAPCDAACEKVNPAELLRSIWFQNEQCAAQRIPEENPCLTCPAMCENACVRPGEVPIREMINRLYYQVKRECETPIPENEDRLKCDLCGIPLENPFMLSSSVVGSTYDMCARAFEAGWAGVCFKTICTLAIHEASPRFSAITGSAGTIIGFKNIEQLSDHSVKENMEIINIKCHDLRHRLRDYEEAHGALTPEMRELTRSINIYDSRLHTGNETLDIVLSDHMLRAVNRSVQLSVVADGQLVAFMERADLYALFDNLLGNALEYLETQPEENRFVRLSVRGMSGFVRIEAENWFTGTLTMDGGLPVSTKGDETEHGFGMKSIRRIVEKYNGTMSVGAENDLFTVRIILKQP